MIYTYTPKRLIAGSALTDALVTYYTASTAYGAILNELMIVNTDAAVRTVTIHIVPLAGTAAVANIIISAESLQPGEQRVYGLSTVIPLGSFIQAKSDAGAVVALSASGVEIS